MTDPIREYLVRVTRHPLDPVKREQMRAAGTLPEDYRNRSIEATDFVTVFAATDFDAKRSARENTALESKGETLAFHEVLGGDKYRELSDYPEHDKLSAVAAQSQMIGEFLDYGLGQQGIVLAEGDEDGNFWPTSKSIQRILAVYFGIDQAKIDAEKALMLEEIRNA